MIKLPSKGPSKLQHNYGKFFQTGAGNDSEIKTL